MIRASVGRRAPRPIAFALLATLGALVGACGSTSPSTGPTVSLSLPTGAASGTPEPAGSPSPTSGDLPSPSGGLDTPAPTPATAACSGNDKNRSFFAEAAASMTWPVYCAVLPAGWYLQAGTYRLADGGELEVTYNGPGDVTLGIVEGNVCAGSGSDIDACAPRDSVIGSANLGTTAGELGRLSNGLVLDVDRGQNPSWRVTGIGLSEADFRAFCAAMLDVGGGT